jgi:hypothetical protein
VGAAHQKLVVVDVFRVVELLVAAWVLLLMMMMTAMEWSP